MLPFPFISQIRNLPGKAVPFVGSTARLFAATPRPLPFSPPFSLSPFCFPEDSEIRFTGWWNSSIPGDEQGSIYRRHSSESSRDILGRNDSAKRVFLEDSKWLKIVRVIDGHPSSRLHRLLTSYAYNCPEDHDFTMYTRRSIGSDSIGRHRLIDRVWTSRSNFLFIYLFTWNEELLSDRRIAIGWIVD